MKKHISFLSLSLSLLVMLAACSSGSSQFTNKVDAPVIISELYGSTTQTLAIEHGTDAHIAWMGFVEANDYRYFEVTKVQVGSQTIVSDGTEISGETYTANSNSIIKDITVNAGSGEATSYANGSVTVAGSGDLKITVKYSPLIAIDSESAPHEAYLIITYDAPKVGSMRVKLTGYTRGVKAEKCTQDPSTMDVKEYTVKGGAFDLYFCSAQVGKYAQNNTSQDPSSADYHGTSTNVATITYDNVITFYQVDDSTVCLLTSPASSIPAFDLPIPEIGNVPIKTMEDIHMAEGSYAECSLDADGVILCPDNIQIEALVALSKFSMTNGAVAAEDLVTEDCPDFGAISGSGTFGESPMKLVLFGATAQDSNTESFSIVDSLITAVIELE